jgi:NADPH:quinone reductase-like Zn-dependent oxidoreductase
MKAIVYNKKHAPGRLKSFDVNKPVPKDTEVLIKIVSGSVNAADYRAMKMRMIPKNRIFGGAISGRVESVGKNVQNFQPGDEVLGDLSDFGFGGFAEYAVAPEIALAIKPAKLSFEDAASLPIAATTALKALRDTGSLQKGQKVLIVGSAGGVGTFAVQLAKYYGAIVTAVCSTKNMEQTSSLGADFIIDYTKVDFMKSNENYHIILAINGTYPLRAYKRKLKKDGIYVMVGGGLVQIFSSIFFAWILSFGTKKMRFLSAKSDPEDLEFVANLAANGELTPIIEKKYPLDNTAEAMDYLSEGHASGKVLILME